MALREFETHDAEEVVLLDHHCGGCGKTHEARVTGRGRVVIERRSPGGDSPQADARVKAQEEAAALVRLARCPACGWRDPAQLRSLWILAALQVAGGLLLGAGAWIAFGLDSAGSRDQMRVVIALAVAGGLVAANALLRVPSRLRGAAERVRF